VAILTADQESLSMDLLVLTKEDETFLRWRKLRAEYNLSSDDMLARRLLDFASQDFGVSGGQEQKNAFISQAQLLFNESPNSQVNRVA